MGRNKVYTDEEIKARQKAWREKNKEKKAEYDKKRREENKEKEKLRHKKYYNDNTLKVLETSKRWREANVDYFKHWREKNPEYTKNRNETYYKTKYGRAVNLINSYKFNDNKYNRGECTITPEWMIENIFNGRCIYCGETDWRKLGCDRIDNSKPHTPDNVVCCCEECNKKRGTKPYEEFMKEMQLKMLEKELES